MEARVLLVVLATLIVVAPSRQQLALCPTPNGDHDDSNSCVTFLRCRNGVATRFLCPQGRPFFDQAVQRCTTQQRPGCLQSNRPLLVATNGGGTATINQVQVAGVPQPLRQAGVSPNFEALWSGGGGAGDVPTPVGDAAAGPAGGTDPNFGAGLGGAAPAGQLPAVASIPVGRGGTVSNSLDGPTNLEASFANPGSAGLAYPAAVSPVGVVVPVGVASPVTGPVVVAVPVGVVSNPGSAAPAVGGGAVTANAGAGTGGEATASAGASASVGVKAAGANVPAGARTGPNANQNDQAWQLVPPGTKNALAGVWVPDANGQPVLLVPGAGLFTPAGPAGGSVNADRQLGDGQALSPPPSFGWTPQPSRGNRGNIDLNGLLNNLDLQPQGQLSQAVARASANSGKDGSVSASAAAVGSGNNQGQGQSQAQGRVQGLVQPGGTITAVFPVLMNTQKQNANVNQK